MATHEREPVVAGAADLHLSYHQFMVVDYGVPLDGPVSSTVSAARRSGLAAAEPGIVLIIAGIHTGYVHVTAAAHQVAPPLSVGDWEDVVEVTVRSTGGTLAMMGLMDDAVEGLPDLAYSGPGDYRVRVQANGRDNAVDMVAEDPVEDYDIATWPAEEAPPVVHKMTSGYGTGLRTRALGGA